MNFDHALAVVRNGGTDTEVGDQVMVTIRLGAASVYHSIPIIEKNVILINKR
jgi:hypothetical protein